MSLGSALRYVAGGFSAMLMLVAIGSTADAAEEPTTTTTVEETTTTTAAVEPTTTTTAPVSMAPAETTTTTAPPETTTTTVDWQNVSARLHGWDDDGVPMLAAVVALASGVVVGTSLLRGR